MDPLRLQKQLRDNSNDLQEYFQDIRKWGEEMKRKEETLNTKEESDPQIPLPRNKVTKMKKTDGEVQHEQPKMPKDYVFWEKFDVEAECEKVDKEKSDSASDSELTDEVDEGLLDLAVKEKQKGNTFVKMGRHEDAIKCYTSAIEAYAYDPIYYANRALCHLKLKQYRNAESDCTTALQIDGEYVKALHRRAIAREALVQYAEAKTDLENVLRIEPDNKESKLLLDKISKQLEEVPRNTEVSSQRPLSKFAISRQLGKEGAHDGGLKMEPSKPIKDIVERLNPDDVAPPASTQKKKTETVVRPQSSPVKPSINVCWPAGSCVKSVPIVSKTPRERSKMPLKRVAISEATLKSEMKMKNESVSNKPTAIQEVENSRPMQKNIKKTVTDDRKTAEKSNSPQVNAYENLDCNVDTGGEDFGGLDLPVPITSVQFYQNWKILKDVELRYLYLRQINPTLYTSVFKDSLETKVFSEILEVLSTVFVSKNVHVFSYLYGLTKVKRFAALVMFMGSKDKLAFLKLIDFMRTDTSRSKEEVDYLIKKFEM